MEVNELVPVCIVCVMNVSVNDVPGPVQYSIIFTTSQIHLGSIFLCSQIPLTPSSFWRSGAPVFWPSYLYSLDLAQILVQVQQVLANDEMLPVKITLQ